LLHLHHATDVARHKASSMSSRGAQKMAREMQGSSFAQIRAMPIRTARPSIISWGVLIALAATSGCRTSPEAKEARFLKRGQTLLAQKDYPRAVLEFRSAAGVMPKDAEPYYRMGLAYLGSGDVASAARSFQRATALNPQHSAAQLKLAELMAISHNEQYIREAVSRLQSVFGGSPDNPEAIDTLALAEWQLGKPEDATQRLEEALKKSPTHLQSSMELARMKLSARDWNGAEAVLKKAVADAPQSAPAALALGELYLFLRQPAKAEAELKRALQLDPKNSGALRGLGAIQIAAKRMDEAEQTYKQLAALPEKTYKPLHAMFVYQFGKREAAVAEFETLAKADADDRAARTRLMEAYFGVNRFSDAENVLAVALKRNPKDTDALLQRARLRLRVGKAADAETDLREVLHFSPDSATAHFLLAGAYRVEGQPNRQQQELQEALRLNPGMLQARLMLEVSFLSAKQAKTALEIMDQAPEPQKKHVLWTLGRNWALLSMGNVQEAKAGIDRALAQGRPPEAVFQNAVLQLLQHDYTGARANLDELLRRDVTDANVIQLLMQTYVDKQELAKGVDRLREIAASKPRSASLQTLLGEWYNRAGNPAAARKAFESAKAADPKFAPADLALAEMDLGEGHNELARERLRAVIASDPKNVPALLMAARADDAAGDRAAVIARYRAVLDLDRSNLIAMNNLAYSLAADDPDQALKLAQQAAETAPDSPNVQDTLGWIYYHKGLYSMAVRYLKNAVDKEANPRRQFHLGMSYLKMGDQTTGQKIVREALQKDPNLAKTEQGW